MKKLDEWLRYRNPRLDYTILREHAPHLLPAYRKLLNVYGDRMRGKSLRERTEIGRQLHDEVGRLLGQSRESAPITLLSAAEVAGEMKREFEEQLRATDDPQEVLRLKEDFATRLRRVLTVGR